MQELLEWHRKSMRSYSETNKMIESLLPKEIEQLKVSHINGQSEFDVLQYRDKNIILSDKYYNQTYTK